MDIKVSDDVSIDEKIENQNLFETSMYDKLTDKWKVKYNYAKIYYEYYGNLEVPRNFRTNDGYSYDENGTVYLGDWISTQRMAYKKGELLLNSERGLLLTNIGMIWSVKKNKEEVTDMCLEYNIDTVKNKSVIEHISIIELKSKIEFLKTYNMRLVDENGLLIDIFYMSGIDMKEKYGISFEELICEYYVEKQSRKLVK